MARIRSIKPKYWDDSKLKNISRDARLLFIGMWTFADDLGVLLADPVWIKSKVFPFDDLRPNELEKWIKEIENQSLIVSGSWHNEKFYHIKNFTKHQVVNKPNNSDVHIPKECISTTFVECKIVPVAITEYSGNGHVSIEGGKDRIGEDKKGYDIDTAKPKMTEKEFLEFSRKMKDDKIFTNPLFQQGVKPEHLDKWILRFHIQIVGDDKLNKDYHEYRKHFKNWLNLQEYWNPPPELTTQEKKNGFSQSTAAPLSRL